jgi:hypothetical protein
MLIKTISSQLQVLNISISWNTTYLDANRWEQLIKKHIPHLNKFHFNYDQYTDDDFNIHGSYAFIDRFTSPFWLERKWLSELKISHRHMFFSIHPYKYVEKDNLLYCLTFSFFFRKEWFNSCEQMKIDTYSIRLTIEDYTTTEKTRLFINKVKSDCVTVQFTHLNINCTNMPIGMLIEIIRLLPNLHSLEISSLSNLQSSSSSVEDIKNQLLVSILNKITKVKLNKFTEKKQIQFLINFCSHMQYLELNCMSNTDFKMLVKLILINQMTHIPNLCFLCFNVPNANENMIRNLAMTINLETLVNNYTIQRIGDKIFLRWKLEL